MKNKLADLNNHLFLELERLNDEDLTGEELAEEIKRAENITKISNAIISNANVVLRAVQIKGEHCGLKENDLKMLE